MGSSILSDISASGGENPVLILDFGSQYTHLITRRIRQLSILTVCISGTSPLHAIASLNPCVIILSGGPNSVHADFAPSFPEGFLKYAEENGVPVLGICYGMQLLVQKLGGEVGIGEKHEYGKMAITVVEKESRFFSPEASRGNQTVWMSHGDEVLGLPEGFKVVARSLQGSVAAIENYSKKFYGLQYHPEVTHSPKGMESLRYFLIDVCGVHTEWNMADVLEEQIRNVKSLVGPDEHVICGLSGGVDSTVAAMLVHKAIGDRLHCLFVDNGLLRFQERERVMMNFQKELHLPVTCIDASEQFLARLKGVEDPEVKRKIIGEEFIHVFEEFAPKVEEEVGISPSFLLQGTLYPDVIESCPPPGSGRTHSHTIKSHHNVGGLPERMNLKLIEPLKLLFKDEVRKLGKFLNVPESFLKRHPFPGPGLAVRIPGDVTKGNALNILREVDEIFIQAIKDADLYDLIWQAFAVFLPVGTVGVQGDQRTYGYPVVLRAITSEDGMTADWAEQKTGRCFSRHRFESISTPLLLPSPIRVDPASFFFSGRIVTSRARFLAASASFSDDNVPATATTKFPIESTASSPTVCSFLSDGPTISQITPDFALFVSPPPAAVTPAGTILIVIFWSMWSARYATKFEE